jgi:hypothetical protein
MISIRCVSKRLASILLALVTLLLVLGVVCEASNKGIETAVEHARAENTELRAIVAQLRELVHAEETGTANQNAFRLQNLKLDQNLLLRASAATGNGNLVLECASAGRLLYRFTCGTGGTTASTFTGVGTCT